MIAFNFSDTTITMTTRPIVLITVYQSEISCCQSSLGHQKKVNYHSEIRFLEKKIYVYWLNAQIKKKCLAANISF